MIEQLNAHMETDDNDNEARIAPLYRILTMHDPEILLPVPEEYEENISTRDALKTNDAEKFKVAIIQEVTDLIHQDHPNADTSAQAPSREVLANRDNAQVQA